jgi:predicted nucleic acid-binding protein
MKSGKPQKMFRRFLILQRKHSYSLKEKSNLQKLYEIFQELKLMNLRLISSEEIETRINQQFMKKFTIDNSVFVKTILEEEGTETALSLIEYLEKSNAKIINPTLFEYEITKVAIGKNVDLNALNQLLSDYKQANLTLLNPTIKHNMKAKEIIASCKKENGFPSYYDAIYHAIALVEGGTLITADEKYYNKTKHFGSVLLLCEGILERV